jgi:hypothetical protein
MAWVWHWGNICGVSSFSGWISAWDEVWDKVRDMETLLAD